MCAGFAAEFEREQQISIESCRRRVPQLAIDRHLLPTSRSAAAAPHAGRVNVGPTVRRSDVRVRWACIRHNHGLDRSMGWVGFDCVGLGWVSASFVCWIGVLRLCVEWLWRLVGFYYLLTLPIQTLYATFCGSYSVTNCISLTHIVYTWLKIMYEYDDWLGWVGLRKLDPQTCLAVITHSKATGCIKMAHDKGE